MLWNTSSTAEADVGLRLVASLVLAVTAALAATHNATAGGKTPAGSAFTYQGRLTQAGEAVTGSADMQFTLWNGPSEEAAQVGPMLVVDDLDLVDGLFTVDLDFGPDAFNGTGRWLEVAVRVPHDPTDTQPFESLSPRQPMMAAPYALHALGIGTVTDSSLDGTYTGELSFTNAANNFAGSFTGAGAGLTGLNASNITFGTIGSGLLSGTYTNALNLANSGNSFAGNGSQLTMLSANNIATGNLDIERLPQNGSWLLTDDLIFDFIPSPTGRIGIGTIVPQRRLHIFGEGGAGTNGIRITHPGVSDPFEGYSSWDLLIGGENNSFPGGFAIADQGIAKLVVDSTGDIGVGTTTPIAALHVKGPGTQQSLPGQHVAVFENTGEFNGADGILIKIDGKDLGGHTDVANNFVTFLNGVNQVVGRIEGFQSNNWTDPPDLSIGNPSVNVPFSAGTPPSLSGGSPPSLSWNTTTIPGGITVITPPFIWSAGSFPTLNPGTLPSIGTPSINWPLPSSAEFEALACWAYEFGLTDWLTLDPISIAVWQIKTQAAQFCKHDGVVYGSKGADYAEWMPKLDPAQRFQFGQIVGVHGGKVSLDTEGADQIMAVSVNPVVLGNMPDDADKPDMVPVSFMGQVPVTVRGEVRAGDYIIPSGFNDGTAIAVAPEYLTVDHLDQVLGRAWSDSDNSIISIITVSIGVNTYDAARVLRQQDQRIEELLNANLELVDRLAALETRLTDLEAAAR